MDQTHKRVSNEELSCENKRQCFLHSLKCHNALMTRIIAEERKLLDRILSLSTKLQILDKDDITISMYPSDLLSLVKGEIIHALNARVAKISENVKQRCQSYNTLRKHHLEFVSSTKAVDWENGSQLNNGSAAEKPLMYYVEHSFDIMYCLHVYEKTIQLCHAQFDTRNTSSIVAYSKAIPLSQSFYDLITEVLFNSHLIDKSEATLKK